MNIDLPEDFPAESGDFVKFGVDAWDGITFQDGRVFKAGNSLAVRIPSGIAKAAKLEEHSAVEIAASGGILWIRKAVSQKLADLVDRIVPENLHAEQFRASAEREKW